MKRALGFQTQTYPKIPAWMFPLTTQGTVLHVSMAMRKKNLGCWYLCGTLILQKCCSFSLMRITKITFLIEYQGFEQQRSSCGGWLRQQVVSIFPSVEILILEKRLKMLRNLINTTCFTLPAKVSIDNFFVEKKPLKNHEVFSLRLLSYSPTRTKDLIRTDHEKQAHNSQKQSAWFLSSQAYSTA